MKNIYIFSGLGTDERVFKNLSLPGCHIKFIRWITPLKNEKINEYAKRLSSQIQDLDPVLIGLSFGGMIAIETAKFLPTEKVILISSVKSRAEVPFYYRFAGAIKLDKVVPARLYKKANLFMYWIFGITTTEEKKLLKSILKAEENKLLRWSIRQAINWKNEEAVRNLFHIHGTADRIFPYRFVKPDKTILQGGHFMIFDRAEEISNLILKEIKS